MQAAWLVIADDLTGLQAITAEFARYGASVRTGVNVLPLASELSTTEVFGIDTATRRLSGTEAERRVKAVVDALPRDSATRVFKQNDSGLQGFVGLELASARGATAARPIFYCPACPNLGRITRAGRQVQLDAAGGTMKEGLSVDLKALLRDAGLTALHLPLERLRNGGTTFLAEAHDVDVVLADAETDSDLDRVVELGEALECRVYAGSVGLAAAAARRGQSLRHAPAPILIVAGSLQSATGSQLDLLRGRADCSEVTVAIGASGALAGAERQASVERICAVLRSGKHCAVRWTANVGQADITSGAAPDAGFWNNAMRTLGEVVAQAVAERPPLGGMIIAGGTTAAAVLVDALNTTRFSALTWIYEGGTLAIAEDGKVRKLPIVTKSGAWGPPDALSVGIERITALQTAYAARDAIASERQIID
jgi:uncharacterized protein YgbK (DUF1537 family)